MRLMTLAIALIVGTDWRKRRRARGSRMRMASVSSSPSRTLAGRAHVESSKAAREIREIREKGSQWHHPNLVGAVLRRHDSVAQILRKLLALCCGLDVSSSSTKKPLMMLRVLPFI